MQPKTTSITSCFDSLSLETRQLTILALWPVLYSIQCKKCLIPLSFPFRFGHLPLVSQKHWNSKITISYISMLCKELKNKSSMQYSNQDSCICHITRGFATCHMTYMHLCLCKSFSKIVPIPKNYKPRNSLFWPIFNIIDHGDLLNALESFQL